MSFPRSLSNAWAKSGAIFKRRGPAQPVAQRPGQKTSQKPGHRSVWKVLLMDGQEIVCLGFRKLLHGRRRFSVLPDTPTPEAALDALKKSSPDIVILDTATNGEPGGAEIIRKVKEADESCRVLVCTNDDSESAVREAFVAGTDGFISKNVTSGELIHAIERVMEGKHYIASPVARKYFEADRPQGHADSHLTPREKEILRYVSLGYSNRDIGATLSISPRTAHNHRVNLMRKLDIHKTAALVNFAHVQGLLGNPPGEGETGPG